MTQIFPSTIRTMTMTEARLYGYCHRGLMLEHDCVSYRLSVAKKDDLYVFKSGPVIYVLTINVRQTYVALDVFMPREEDPLDNIFIQGNYAISELIGHDWRSLSLVQLVTRLVRLFA